MAEKLRAGLNKGDLFEDNGRIFKILEVCENGSYISKRYEEPEEETKEEPKEETEDKTEEEAKEEPEEEKAPKRSRKSK